MFLPTNRIATFAASLAMLAAGCWGQTTQSITLDGTGTGKIFQGLGGVSGGAASRLLIDYPEPYRSQILDYLFKPNYGASLQHLKVELGGDMNSTDGAEPSHMHSATDQNYTRGYEWWLMQQAKLRNPNITLEALAWGAPGWIGNGNFFSQDNINYILNFIQGAKSTYGLTIDYIGIWNETDFDPYWIINLKAALQQAGLSTKVIAADQGGSNTTIISDMVNIGALDSAVDVIGIHYPSGSGQPYSQPLNGQPVWASEEGPWRGDWTGATFLARVYNLNYVNLKITLSEIWSLVTSYYDVLPIPGSGLMYANTPWSGNYDVQPAIWATAHTTQFAQPGWQYVDSASGVLQLGGSFVTLKNGSDYSVILETTQAGASQTVTFNITGGLSSGTVHVWATNSITQFVQQSDIIPVNGSFSITLAPGSIYSLTTTTGQAKGNAVPPAASPFPFPYSDNFESYTPGQEAQYFSAMNGSFEAAACGAGRSGTCLRQAVNAPPIPWSQVGPIEPATVLGTSGWTNYQVSADVLLEQTGSAKLIGRFSGVDINAGNVWAYQFYVGTGGWSLCHGDTDVLASGTTSIAPNTWHTISLILNGTQIQGLIDGVMAASITDSAYANGMAGVGVQSWINAQFDNFQVALLPGTAQTIPQSQMSATATSETTGYEASKAIDANPNTFWISAFSCTAGCMPTVALPQSITLALGGSYNVNTLTYLPRQDSNLNGAITNYNVYASSDGVNFTNVATGNWAGDSTLKSVSFTQTSASYLRLEAIAGVGGYAAASEINVEYALGGSNPTPSISTMSPTSAGFGTSGFTLTVSGGSFVNGASVLWNGSNRTTKFVSSTVLTASIPASDVAGPGTATVSVFNPQPGGGTSNSLTFTISTPISVTVQASPAGPSFTVDGSSSTAAQTLTWTGGTSHTIATTSPQSAGTGTQSVWSSWSDGGAISHTVTPTGSTTFTANFTTQYLLTTGVSPAASGTVTAGAYYNSGTPVQLTATPAAYCAFSSWSGGLTGSANPASVTMSAPMTVTANFQCTTPPASTTFVTGYALSGPAVRNDFTGWVGMKLTVGAAPLSVTTLGRICVANNSQTHTVKFVSAATGSDVAGASASVNMAGCTAGQFVYQAISPVSLAAGASYYLASQETQGGDRWYDAGTISTKNDAVVINAAYLYNGSWYAGGSASTSYVPPNFQYSAATPSPISVTVQASPTGASFTVDGSAATAAQTLTWSSGTSHTIATTSPQSAGTGTQYAWSSWSDGGAISHAVAPTAAATYTASFTTQYLLTTSVSPAGGGTVTAGGYSNSGTSVQLTATPAVNCTFSSWSGGLTGSTNPKSITMSAPQTVTANFQCTVTTPPPSTGFVTGYALNGPSLRNDYAGWVGMKLTVGSTPLSVSALGRICATGNSQSHTVKFVNVSDGSDVAGASASVNMAGCAAGQFVYQAISPVSLAAGASYYLASQETQGGDRWYDSGTISVKTDAVVSNAAYLYNGSWYAGGSANTSYVPPNFQYSTVTPSPISVTVQASPTGASVTVDGSASTAAQTLTWSSGTSHTIATTSPQSAGTGTQYAWSSWSDGGGISHSVAPTAAATYTASFTTQYLLTTSVSPAGGGTVTAGGYSNSGTSVQLTATPAVNCTFSSWSGGLTGSASPTFIIMSAPQTVTANFQCTVTPPSSTVFLTGYALNGPSLRNDFTGWVGMKLTAGASALTVSSLGRLCVAGNSQAHTVKFVNAATGSDVAGASASVNMAGCTEGQFVYQAISPVTLSAGAAYYLVTQETQGGDRWYDQGTVSTTTDAAVSSAIYAWNGSWYPASAASSYVPPNFQYSVSAH